ncbi:MAG TPA: Tim44 domain-containing protein [Candidatus Binatia bacterium]|jgi:predicted lipid-binding transport protein (Tim44 family)|nr:Tim44 domain-containing protein [Candidatus Binatia bacterium]
MRFSTAKMLLATMSILFFVALAQIVFESYADARAGGGRSGGFRGSRSYSSPARPTQPSSPAQPSKATNPSQQPSPMAPQPGGFMRTFGTAMLGGFLGSMLFSGLANAGFGGLGGSGFGLIEILLFAGIGYFIYRKFRSPALATGYGSMQYQNSQPYTSYTSSNPQAQETASSNEIDYRSLTLMDRSFNPDQFLKTAQDSFFKIQGAWNKQDTKALTALCGRELMKTWEEELTSLRARGQQNRMENIALRDSQITEVWTENGEDYITVRLLANLLDYNVDAKTGAVVSGSNSDPIQFEEYWTFNRPVGPNSWKLTAVQQA